MIIRVIDDVLEDLVTNDNPQVRRSAATTLKNYLIQGGDLPANTFKVTRLAFITDEVERDFLLDLCSRELHPSNA